MNAFEEVFVILHIRLSSIKVHKLQFRTAFTIILMFLLSYSVIQLYLAMNKEELLPLDILGSFVFMGLVLHFTYNWVITWPKANRLLSKASDISHKDREKETNVT
jgi:uncharacterized membrane protein YozB (DUF420 family)